MTEFLLVIHSNCLYCTVSKIYGNVAPEMPFYTITVFSALTRQMRMLTLEFCNANLIH